MNEKHSIYSSLLMLVNENNVLTNIHNHTFDFNKVLVN